jgi:hypothetical protein
MEKWKKNPSRPPNLKGIKARLVFPLSPTHHNHHQTTFPIPCLKERRRKQKNKGNKK